MISKNNQPTTAQKKWMETVAGLGSMASYGPVEVHHPIGRSAKIKGIGNVGHWFCIPISRDDHLTRHRHGRRAFEEATGKTEKSIFVEVCKRVKELPFGSPIYNAILDYHK